MTNDAIEKTNEDGQETVDDIINYIESLSASPDALNDANAVSSLLLNLSHRLKQAWYRHQERTIRANIDGLQAVKQALMDLKGVVSVTATHAIKKSCGEA